uniref:Reverse transcriptase zinc-binding domain-containing protein n=1 Tax=Ditylenchus dipsaci TaxID=166011 RepID=A0A915EUE0_9BILA
MLSRGQPRSTVGVTADQAEAHWRTIYGTSRPWRPDEDLVSWMEHMQSTIPAQRLSQTEDHALWCRVLKKAKPWKAPGPDGIPNFYWKNLPSAKKALFSWILRSKNHRSIIPSWLPRPYRAYP